MDKDKFRRIDNTMIQEKSSTERVKEIEFRDCGKCDINPL